MIKESDAVFTPEGRFGEVVGFNLNAERALVRFIGHGQNSAKWFAVSDLRKSKLSDPLDDLRAARDQRQDAIDNCADW